MNRFLIQRWSWLVGGLLVFTSIALAVEWLVRPDDVQADFQITRAYLTAAVYATGTAPAMEATSQRMVQLTQVAPTSTILVVEVPTATHAVSEENSVQQAADQPTLVDSSTATLVCDRAIAGNPIDISIPDDTQFLPRQAFTKIWRLQNAGGCTWSKEYTARFFYGDRMDAPEMVYLEKIVSPGAVIEIAVDMVAPNEPGSYQGNWKLSNANGTLFGIGPRSDAPFWVRIVVLRMATPTLTPTNTPTPTATYTPVATLTPTSSPTAPVQNSGNLVVKVSQKFDLDTGQVDPITGQDVAFKLEGGFHFLTPQPGALLGVYGSQEPGREDCIASVMSPAPIAVESLSPGAYLCYQTNAGLPGWLRFVALDSQDGSASLVYRTWVFP